MRISSSIRLLFVPICIFWPQRLLIQRSSRCVSDKRSLWCIIQHQLVILSQYVFLRIAISLSLVYPAIYKYIYIYVCVCVFNHPLHLSSLRRALQVLHGADSDILWLQRDFGLYVVNMFDTGQVSSKSFPARCSHVFLLL